MFLHRDFGESADGGALLLSLTTVVHELLAIQLDDYVQY